MIETIENFDNFQIIKTHADDRFVICKSLDASEIRVFMNFPYGNTTYFSLGILSLKSFTGFALIEYSVLELFKFIPSELARELSLVVKDDETTSTIHTKRVLSSEDTKIFLDEIDELRANGILKTGELGKHIFYIRE